LGVLIECYILCYKKIVLLSIGNYLDKIAMKISTHVLPTIN